jgi:hypothetical protein
LPDPVQCAAIISASSSGNHKPKATCTPYVVVAQNVDTKSTGCSFQAMARSAIDKIPPGPKLDALTAEKVFGWQKVHKHQRSLVGRKPDQAGRWRLAKVPRYSTNVGHAYAIEDQMKRLGRFDQYWRELQRYARSTSIPSFWATPEQRCRAAIKAVGQYGQVIPLSRSRKQSRRSAEK